MSPELRFVAQLNRLSRALEQASDRAWELRHDDTFVSDVLEKRAAEVRKFARGWLEWVAERGSAESAG